MTNEAHTELFQKNLSWAATLARLIHKTLPPSFDQSDLIQIAWIELWKRVELYNGNLGDTAKFRGYAHIYIRGACRMATRRNHYREATHEELITFDDADREQRKGGTGLNWGPSNPRFGSAIAEPMDPEPLQDEAMTLRHEMVAEDKLYDSRRRSMFRHIKGLPRYERLLIDQMLSGKSVEDMAKTRGISKVSLSKRLSAVVRKLKGSV